ncbi:oxidoreductase|uniref:PDR/VanB family oxidoreductase n=1 Tax=Stenotrophomonas sp. SbOxS2 TaxID=2723885 RepID=UPI0015D30547|nr:PDR/VanB family oxidoreductase [Stenotrophomonas sp. SbOxS2]NYT99477.1 oxidoreductase [Stenotrophomonas sp. SbOxS2]
MIQVRVHALSDECAQIRSLELRSVDGAPLPAFSAGAHVDVQLPGGLIRQYSLCNAPHENHRYVIGVLHAPDSRGGSRAVHALQAGDMLEISAPRNLFALHPQPVHSLLLAGGIGITPLLAMAEHLAAQGAPFALHYAARSAAHAGFLQRLAQAPWAAQVHLHFDDGPAQQRLDMPALLAAAPADSHLYVCGPAGFMAHVLEAGANAGWEQARLHREYFGAAPAQAQALAVTSFEVQIASSGQVFTIPAEQSIAQVLDQAGVFVPVSCEQGICGTCLTPVLEGVPEHRDQFLSFEEHARNDQMTVCCSRARSARLVLDL